MDIPCCSFLSNDVNSTLGHMRDLRKTGKELYIFFHEYSKRSDSRKWFDDNSAIATKQKSLAYNAQKVKHSRNIELLKHCQKSCQNGIKSIYI